MTKKIVIVLIFALMVAGGCTGKRVWVDDGRRVDQTLTGEGK